MNDDLSAILGKFEELVGGLQEKYGIAKEKANKQTDDYRNIVRRLRQSDDKLMKLQKVLIKKKLAGKRTAKRKHKRPAG